MARVGAAARGLLHSPVSSPLHIENRQGATNILKKYESFPFLPGKIIPLLAAIQYDLRLMNKSYSKLKET